MTSGRNEPVAAQANDFVGGGGEMGALIRAMDWSRTPLGPIHRWPQSLRSAVSILLPSKAQIALFWGEELITLYNDAYRPVFGAKHPAALGKPIREAWDELWRAGLREIFDGVLATGEAFWAQDRPFFMERYGYLEETYFDVSYDPVRDESGGVGGVFCIVSETTRRVIGERRLRALRDLGAVLQHMRAAADVYHAALDVLSRFAEDIPFALLYSADDPGASARLVAQVGLPHDDPAAPHAMEPSWPTPGEVVVLTDAQLSHFGELHAGPWPELIREAVVTPLAAAGRDAQGYFVAGVSPRRRLDEDHLDFLRLIAAKIASALTSAREAEAERRRAQLLAELDRAKTAFFSNVSHEFRTPLTLMLGPIEDLLAAPQEQTLREHCTLLTTVRRNGQRLLKLVNTLLDFARIEAGRVRACYEPVDLGALTRDLASNFRSACERAGVALNIDCPPSTTQAYVDREMWEKIVLNLISNAFKFTVAGEIAVRLRETDATLELTVRDTGAGVPPEALPHIFERFYRAANARARSHEGSGIGLALVHELVRLHGGTIQVDSTAGQGATFTVSIPKGCAHLPREQVHDRVQGLLDEPSTAVRPAAYVDEALGWLSEAAPAPASVQRRCSGRVLLADDNADLREYAHRLLADHYDVEAVADGEAALAAARAAPPDLIVADVMMPGLDGFELIREVRADARLRATPVILLSARAGEEARIEGLDKGADDYLVKPFSARELLVRVDSLLRIAQVRRDALEQQQIAAEQAREQLEELEALLQALPVGVFIARDAACTNITANAAGAAMLRIPQNGNASKSGPAAESLPFRVLKNGVEVSASDLPMQRSARSGRAVVGEELEIEFTDGARITLYECAVPLFDAAGEVRGSLGVFVDLTERKRMEQALREREESLRQADRRKDEFLAMLAHELRNPLAPIANALQLLRRDGSPDPIQRQARAIIDRQTGRLARLVDDLLEVSRITSGRIQLHMQLVAISGIVQRAIETVRPMIEEHRHALSVSLPSGPLFVRADAARLEQVLVNLLNNAAKYTDDGGRIEVAARMQDSQVVLSVRDTGIGIDPVLLPRIFDLFVQAERSLDRSGGGLGIGLSLVQQLVAMHGGTIEAHSVVEQGSEFIVRLPSAQAPNDEAVAGAAHIQRAAVRPLRILIVDDNVDAAKSLALLLEAAGHSVCAVHDGRTALEAARRCRPHLALLDIGLPSLDGYALARRLRDDQSLGPMVLVALTGYGQAADRERSRTAGFDRHLTKPADFSQIEQILVETAAALEPSE